MVSTTHLFGLFAALANIEENDPEATLINGNMVLWIDQLSKRESTAVTVRERENIT